MCIVYSRNVTRARGCEIASVDVPLACYKGQAEALHDFANQFKAADDAVLQGIRSENSWVSGSRVTLGAADALQDCAARKALVST